MNEMGSGLGGTEGMQGPILTRVWHFARAFISVVQKVPHPKAGRTRNSRATWQSSETLRVSRLWPQKTVRVSHSVVSDSL